ncbi:MAG: glycosyltransferase family 4 protein [Gallionella sp.]|nr:glycosyltransferase family 4 protein [Gallionella sp.]
MIEGEIFSGNRWLFLGVAVIFSGLVSWLTIALMLRFGRVGPIDQPNHRSLHQVAMPRSGGVGILAGIAVGLVGAMLPMTLWIALGALVGVSLLDDFRPLPAQIRFLIQLVAAALATWILVPPEWGVAGQVVSVLCMVWMTNLYNFMDGANGLAGGMAVFGFAGYALAASFAGQFDLAIWSACIAAAAGGFLIFNFDPARIFMGDVGSVPLGFLAAVLGLHGLWLGAWPAWFPVLVFSVFIVDATVTLLRRGLRGEKVWLPHREHYYQRLIQSGWSHRRLALAAYLLMFVTGGSACLLTFAPPTAQVFVIATWGMTYFMLMRKIDRRAAGIPGKAMKLPNEQE